MRNGKALILSNAHVCGSRIGREVVIEVQSQGNERIRGRVIMAAYSDRTWTDWAVVETIEPYNKVQPVKCSKNRPSGSHYTRGFPRCQPHNGTDIRTVALSSTDARWTWQPNAIGGQSGSGVWSDVDNLQYGLLTWSIGRDGAGQMTSEIYRQARDCTIAGAARVDGMIELDQDYDFTGIDTDGLSDPVVVPGLYIQRDITTLPIWAEDDDDGDDPVTPPNDPDDISATALQKIQIEGLRAEIETKEKQLRKLQGLKPPSQSGEPVPDNEDAIQYGL
jgi:pimeloyl-ACP methyl ester carboxylesterase